MADYDLGTARGRIDIDASGAVKGAGEAAVAAEGLEKSTKNVGASANLAGGLLIGFGAAAVGAFALSLNAAAGFEKKLSEFKAVSGATADQIELVSEKALQLGADTSFSAGEAADAMNELAKSGLSVGDILNGAADATTYLAAAGSVALPEAASIISAALNQFKLDAADLPRVADLIAGAANASATGVSEIGLALEYVGPVAKAAGLSIDDTAGAIALLANNGIDANKAGTSLRGILSSLQPNSKAASNAMKELGLITADGSNQFFDATGKIKSMQEIIGILNKSFGGLTEQQRLAYSETIFGREQLAAINAMASTTTDEFANLQDVIGNTSAQEVANTKMDNLAGSVEELKGSVETFMIKAGRPFQAGLKSIVDALTGVVNWFTQLNPEVLKWVGYGVAAAGVIAILVGGLLLAQGAIEKVKMAFGALNAVMDANPIALVVIAIAALAAGLYWLYENNETFRKGVDKLWESFGPIWDAILAKAQEVWGWLAANVPPIWDAIWNGLTTAWQWVVDNIWPKVVQFAEAIPGAYQKTIDWFNNVFLPKIQEIWDQFQLGLDRVSAYVEEHFGGVLDTIGQKAGETKDSVVTAFQDGTIQNAVTSAASSISSGFSTVWTWITESLIPALQSFAQTAGEQFALFAGWFNEHVGPVIGSLGELWNAIWQKAQEAWDQLWPILQAAGIALAAIIGAIVIAAMWIWENFGDEIWQTIQSVWEQVKSIIEAALKVIQGIIEVVTGLISGDWGKVWDGIKNILAGVWDAIWAVITGMMDRIKIWIDGAMEVLKDLFSKAWQWIVDNGPQKLGELLTWVAGLPGAILSAIGNSIYEAGKSILEGLWNGLKDKWNEITGWLSGLNPAQFKGPPERDEQMLVPNGHLIMAGLQEGMASEWENIKVWLSSLSSDIEKYVLYEDGSIGVQKKDAGGNWFGAGPANKTIQDWAAVKSLQGMGWTQDDVKKIGDLIAAGGKKAMTVAAAAPMVQPTAKSPSYASTAKPVTVNINITGMDPRDAADVRAAFDGNVLTKITNAARAGVGG